MISGVGVVQDGTDTHLLADFINPLFAYSLNRKLRNLYAGDYFSFRQANGVTGSYPTTEPDLSDDVFVTKIFDQKSKYGVPVKSMIQTNESLQPKLTKDEGLFRAVFSGTEYLEPDEGDSYLSSLTDEFYILLAGKTDYPRPALGMWGEDDAVTIEPSTSSVAKFTVNRNRGSMRLASDANIYGCYYGVDSSQNNQRVMSLNGDGHNLESDNFGTIENIAIGRMRERYYTGEVLEVVGYGNDLNQKWHQNLFKQLLNNYISYR